MTQANQKIADRNSLKTEAAEIRKQLKIKSISSYTKNKLTSRYAEISDILCGFNNEGKQVEGFTGGEWEARQSRGNNAYEWRVAVRGGRNICEMEEATDLEDIKTVKANAALIAKAPDMFRLINTFISILDPLIENPAHESVMIEAKAIINTIK